MNEIRKQIENYSNYTISECGEVISYKHKQPKILKAQKLHQTGGYKSYSLYSDDKKLKIWTVHKLVWTAFKGEVKDGYVIDHIDGDTTNNHISNLQVITRSENAKKGKKSKWTKTAILNAKTGEMKVFRSTLAAARFIKENLELKSSIETIRDRVKACMTSPEAKKAYKTYFCFDATKDLSDKIIDTAIAIAERMEKK